ncbi:MarR family winged helix-turn-helix transcriptional regulator [Inmirania thermothiophila]|uniref:DNA-binding MarR family transcriptional regulator n=1 Tax=Inmirania thermothiophila TaxID=1750597 RepID=A0A3N1YC48_9GAMM|nr:MarR family winged helix-turn-helix transcriptional regulator [Inmirania thermothiophila]ROR34957.1 DNA-binding MarR family transcriptional regulator [Inmirania thermothiophila]
MDTEHRLYELLERIGRLLRPAPRSASGPRLQPVHLAALHYLARANRYSDGPAAVAEYLGLTKGTVSQSLRLLRREGLIEAVADGADGRRIHLRPTPAGERLLAEALPPPLWRRAAGALAPEAAEALAAGLTELLRALQRAHGGRTFGLCADCRHLRADPGGGHRCGLTGEPLAVEETRRLCRDQEPAA